MPAVNTLNVQFADTAKGTVLGSAMGLADPP